MITRYALMSPHFSYSSLELERPSINQEGYALLALHHYVPPSLCMERTRIFQIKYVGNKKVFSQNIQICINHDGRDEITIFNLFQSFRSSSCGEKKTIINLKSNDVVRDCYSAVMKENFFYFFFFFISLLNLPRFSLICRNGWIYFYPIIVGEEIVAPPNLPTRPREISEKRSHWHCFFFLLVSHLHPLKKEEEITDKMAKLIVSMDLLRGRVGNGSKGKVHQECAIFTQIPHANRRRLSTKCYSYSRCCICVYGSRIIHSTFFFFFFLFIKAKQFIKIKRIGHGLRHQERLYIYTQRERPTRQLKRVWFSCFFFHRHCL